MHIISLLASALILQQTSVQIGSDGKSTRIVVRSHDAPFDSTRIARRDSIARIRKPIVATPDQIATAFADPTARSLLERARAARIAHDSSITSYDATSYQRLTAGLAFTKLGRERILFRHESSARVRWRRGVGAQIDITGKRAVAPIFGGAADVEIESMLSPVPYFPGRDALWVGSRVTRDTMREGEPTHPLARGAEAVYTYRSGDSVSFHLPDGRAIQLRELEVRPRQPSWSLVVATLWFDVATAQLVRAAYRWSEPYNLLTADTTDPRGNALATMILGEADAAITGVAVEFGLYQGFWLPRSQVAEGYIHSGFFRMPLRWEERFRYSSVNGADTVAAMRAYVPAPALDTSSLAGLRGRARERQRRRLYARQDSIDNASRARECASPDSTRTTRANRYRGTLEVLVRIPCDSAKLARSPELPTSIFDSGDEVFGDADRDALLARAEQLKAMLDPLRPRAASVRWSVDLVRYNRVEGLSSAIVAEQRLGERHAVRAIPRIGMDAEPNGELILERRGPWQTTRVTGFRRLTAANDWGQPLSLGASLSTLMFGEDEGFYYRAAGAELTGEEPLTGRWNWRLFYENQRGAETKFRGSLASVLNGPDLGENVVSAAADQVGLRVRSLGSHGLDPRGFRLLTDVRAEAATGSFDYARGALDLTLSRGLGRAFGNELGAALTAGAGIAGGALPPQRQWFLGGLHSIRGESPGVFAGNSYWLTHLELGRGSVAARRVLFADVGWAGDRKRWNAMGRPASGVGIGLSMLDGLVRIDLARGLYPRQQWRFGTYFEARF